MPKVKYFMIVLACALLCEATVVAQNLQQNSKQASDGSQSVAIIIERGRLRFTAPASAQELRLEVFDKSGELVYDSGVLSTPEISWDLQNANGGDIPSGLYSYTLTIKDANSETPATRRGRLILESGRDRLWVTSQGAIGAEESLSGGELTVSSDSEVAVAGARLGRRAASNARHATNGLNSFDTATPGRIPKFDNNLFLINSVITEDALGRIGIGVVTPSSALTVAGRIESKEGGIKFPDGTVQLTSAAASSFQVNHNATLTGNGTIASPLGVNIPALGLLSAVAHDTTLAGNGTTASPLGVTTPLVLNNASLEETIRVKNSVGTSLLAGGAISAVNAIGLDSNSGAGGNGIVASAGSGPAGNGLAGKFNGDVQVTGNLSKGGGSFKIDHPLDPANKYLYHSFVESPDMKNVYDGNVTTDQNGEATVTLPDYFESLNRDFRYQLTVIGQFAQAIVASKISDNRFTIKTDRPGVEVSWQVTGIRQDAYANKHRIPVEEMKPERERGYYLHPQVFDQPEEKSVEWARDPEMMRQIKNQRQEAEMRRREKENDR